MKAIIPLAGKGTRLRPHTHRTPKPLLRVGGRPVLGYVLDDLVELGISEMVFIVGYRQEEVRAYMSAEYPGLRVHYVTQEVQDGTAGAVKLAEPYADEELLILFVDTLFDADLGLTLDLPADLAGVIWAKEVEDYQRFGVIVTAPDGTMTRIVEKPTEPVSRLANIGLYFIRDYGLLYEGLNAVLEAPPGPSGEFFLTDAFQYMVDHGARILTAPVEGWYDCGKPETLLETNRHLLETGRGGVSSSASISEGAEIVPPVRLEAGVTVRGGRVGPNVTLEQGVTVVDSKLESCIVGAGARIEWAELSDSLIGEGAEVRGVRGALSVGDHASVLATP